jgi:disulfide oxidoreductase YuzD
MTDFKFIKYEEIKEWCIKNNQVEWLKAAAKEKYTNEDGTPREITYVDLKLAFFDKFFPEQAPKRENKKKKTIWEDIEAL